MAAVEAEAAAVEAEAAPEEPEEEPMTLESLPTVPLLLILSFLDFRDLLSCGSVSRRLNELSSYDPLWRRHCKAHWRISEERKRRKNRSWKSLFRDAYRDLGRIAERCAAMRRAWAEIVQIVGAQLPAGPRVPGRAL